MARDVLVLWREGDWRCEYHAGIAGEARLVVYSVDHVVSAESVPAGAPAYHRAEVLRQRMRRGDLGSGEA